MSKQLDRAIEAGAQQFGGLGTLVSRVRIVQQCSPEVRTCMGFPLADVLARARELLALQTSAKVARCEAAARTYRENTDPELAPVLFDDYLADGGRTYAQEYREHIEFVLDDCYPEDPGVDCIY